MENINYMCTIILRDTDKVLAIVVSEATKEYILDIWQKERERGSCFPLLKVVGVQGDMSSTPMQDIKSLYFSPAIVVDSEAAEEDASQISEE